MPLATHKIFRRGDLVTYNHRPLGSSWKHLEGSIGIVISNEPLTKEFGVGLTSQGFHRFWAVNWISGPIIDLPKTPIRADLLKKIGESKLDDAV
jgi:hypothetical protein